MEEGASAQNVSAPYPINRNINDRVEHKSVRMIGSTGCLSGLKCRAAKGQVVELKVESQAKVAVRVARDTDGSNAAATANEVPRVPIREAGAAARIEGPLVECLRLLPAHGDCFFGR